MFVPEQPPRVLLAFLRCSFGELPPEATMSTPSGFEIGTTQTSVVSKMDFAVASVA